MGASNSQFVKAEQPANINENKLLNIINQPPAVSSFQEYVNQSGIPNIVDDDLKRYTDEYKFLLGKYGTCEESNDDDIRKKLDEIENAYKLYLLYDNYKIKNKVMNKDLNKKYKNQNKNIKSGYESVDKIKVIIKDLELSILNKKRNQKILNFILVIVILMVLVIAFLLYKKMTPLFSRNSYNNRNNNNNNSIYGLR